MKQKLMWMLLLLAGIQVYSFAQINNKQQHVRPMVVENGIKEIVVSDNIDVLLIQSTDGKGWVKVPDNTLGKLKVNVGDEKISLSAMPGLSGNERLQVYIQVENLSTLVIKGSATVASRGVLNAEDLEVFVSENSRAILRTKGSVRVVKQGKYEIIKEADHSLLYAAD